MVKFTRHYLENIFFVVYNFLLSPIFYFITFINKFRSQKKLKILVIQTAKIGDLVCSTPVFREIKKHYPKSFLSVLVIPLTKDILVNNPYINEVILFDEKKYYRISGALRLIREIKKRKFNWSFSLIPGILNSSIPFLAGIPNRVTTTSKYSTRGAKLLSVFNNYRLEYKRHTLALKHYLNLLKFIGIKKTNPKKEIFVNLKEKEKASRFLEKHELKTSDFLVGISVAAGNKLKEWPLEKFAQLTDKLIEELKAKVIFVGSRKEGKLILKTQNFMKNRAIDASQSFSLSEVPALFKYFKLFISVDTGSLYIADAVGIPVMDIAGPCEMRSQRPSGKFVIIQKSVACGPCSFIMSAPSYCKERHLKCIKDIEVDDVYIAVKKMLYDFKI